MPPPIKPAVTPGEAARGRGAPASVPPLAQPSLGCIRFGADTGFRRPLLFFLWMLSLSLKNEADNTAYPPVLIPHPPTLANFIDVHSRRTIFLSYTINSVIVSFSATGLALLFGVPAAYGIAKTQA